MKDERDRDFMVLLYDLERYGGETRAPLSVYPLGARRFYLNAFGRQPGQLFHTLLWNRGAESHAHARGLVPAGGDYFDRSKNFPSPMVPIEGWLYDAAPAEPPRPAEVMP